jgi:2-methylcitrate dehydratase PrpD
MERNFRHIPFRGRLDRILHQLALAREGDRKMRPAGAAGESITASLGDFVARSRWSDIPASVRHEAKRSILNIFGTSLGAANHPELASLMRLLAAVTGPPQATVIGRIERLDILNAAFANAVSANFLDFDDTHLETVIHPSAPVAPPLFALAEQRGLSGAQILHAFVLGVEIECRLGNSVSPHHYARGWHITATCGVFGAAAASARLIGLDAASTAHAIGIAGSQSAGIAESLATAAKNVGIGNSARNGLLAALLAELGYMAAPRAIEGAQGWARATGDEPKLDKLLAGLGESWEIARNAYKPYPCGIELHAVIDACFELRSKYPLAAADIVAVTVAGHPLLLARADRPVANERDAKISIHHSVAAVFMFGAAGVREYSDAVVMDPAVVAFRERVRAEIDGTLAVGAARVGVQTTGGQVFSAKVMRARGSLDLPMTDAQIEQKVRDLASIGCPACDADRLIGAVWELDRAADVRPLLRLVAAA